MQVAGLIGRSVKVAGRAGYGAYHAGREGRRGTLLESCVPPFWRAKMAVGVALISGGRIRARNAKAAALFGVKAAQEEEKAHRGEARVLGESRGNCGRA